MKKAEEIAVVLNVRKNSQRCKNKLLRDYAGTTLFDIALDKIAKLNWTETYLGAYEEEFKEKAKAFPNITIIHRSHASANADAGTKLIFEMYTRLPHRWVFWLNPCHALLRLETIQRAIETFLEIDNQTMTSVKALPGWFYLQDGTPLNNRNCYTGVNKDDYLYVGAHAFHAYERKTPLESERVWDNVRGEPYLYPIAPEEAYDVDSEEDFVISETLYKYRFRNEE